VVKQKALIAVKLFVCLLFLLAPVVVLAEGARELDFGPKFPDSCASCHGSTPKYGVLNAQASYAESGHATLGNAFYANGNGCQQCHTNEGFIEYVQTGKVEGYVAAPSQPGCFTCHDPHDTGDFRLRTTQAVVLTNGEIFNQGDGNLCASCHQSRAIPTETVKAMPASSIRSYWGAHHGPQSDMVVGTNAYEFSGKNYSSSLHSFVVTDGCVDCHMSYPAGRFSLAPGVGGHSMNIEGEVHHAPKVNVSACNECHTDIGQVRGSDIFDKLAAEDYDNDGTVEPMQAEVKGLLDAFVNSGGTGILQTLSPPFYKADGSWDQASSSAERPVAEVAALFNYKFVLEDRSDGIHNAKYAIQLLYDSIEALTNIDTSSLRPQ
jgi:hypothetical protein